MDDIVYSLFKHFQLLMSFQVFESYIPTIKFYIFDMRLLNYAPYAPSRLRALPVCVPNRLTHHQYTPYFPLPSSIIALRAFFLSCIVLL